MNKIMKTSQRSCNIILLAPQQCVSRLWFCVKHKMYVRCYCWYVAALLLINVSIPFVYFFFNLRNFIKSWQMLEKSKDFCWAAAHLHSNLPGNVVKHIKTWGPVNICAAVAKMIRKDNINFCFSYSLCQQSRAPRQGSFWKFFQL